MSETRGSDEPSEPENEEKDAVQPSPAEQAEVEQRRQEKSGRESPG